jgi:beta-lactamase class A
MSLAALAEATQLTSENLAANLLLGKLGGPAGFTSRLHRRGDRTTRLDRLETAKNLVRARSAIRQLRWRWREPWRGLLWRGGSGRHREKVLEPCGVPSQWRAGDKTGTGMSPQVTDQDNDAAVVWAPGRDPVVVAGFCDRAVRSAAILDALQGCSPKWAGSRRDGS